MEALLREGRLEVLGRLADSSNGAVLVRVLGGDRETLAIHKPIVFERPLWDFPTGHLAWRELAAHLVCRAAGLTLIPPTVLRDGPWGPGALQEWIGGAEEALEDLVTVCAPEDVPTGWLGVMAGEDEEGESVVLAHSAEAEVQDLALLDAVLNNTDRKGSHIVRSRGSVWAFDHGITLGAEPKLRTVLWGWAGEALTDRHQDILGRLAAELVADDPNASDAANAADVFGSRGSSGSRGSAPAGATLGGQLAQLLEPVEIEALRERITRLRRTGRFPQPSRSWPAIPWPAL